MYERREKKMMTANVVRPMDVRVIMREDEMMTWPQSEANFRLMSVTALLHVSVQRCKLAICFLTAPPRSDCRRRRYQGDEMRL